MILGVTIVLFALLEIYASNISENSAIYHRINDKSSSADNQWYKNQPLGMLTIADVIPTIARLAG